MEQYPGHLIPWLFEIDDEIEANSETLTLKKIYDMQLVIYFINLRLYNVRNSKLAINRLIPDILYKIFTLAVHASEPIYDPERAVLSISHVCRHWRESALGWPALWAFLDLSTVPPIFDLYVKRSQNAPLTLSWRGGPEEAIFDYVPSKPYFMSNANSILSRTHTLSISTTFALFPSLHRGLLDSGLPFQLRRLHISLYHPIGFGDDDDKPLLPQITHLIDNSFLREIELLGYDLPWLQLPHNELTRLRLINPLNPPTLSQLLVFLSNCRALKVLEIEFRDSDVFRTTTVFDMAPSTSSLRINKIDFPNLTELGLRSSGPSSYDFILQISRRIQTFKPLSQFKLFYQLGNWYAFPEKSSLDQEEDDSNDEEDGTDEQDDDPIPSSPSFPIFEAIPEGICSRLPNYRFLDVSLEGQKGRLRICGHMSAPSDCPLFPDTCPLVIQCQYLRQIDYSLIREFVQAIPYVQHLRLKFDAWILISKKFDIRGTFPNLHTLELIDSCVTRALKSLPRDFKLKHLIPKSCAVSYKVLSKVVLRTGIEVLELIKGCRTDEEKYADVVSDLRRRGVVVVST